MDSEDNPTNLVAQQRIEQEITIHYGWIAYHEECIRMLKEEGNELKPISRLPPEILGTVFSFVLAGHACTIVDPFPLYYFTHVSRSWRSVALDTPRLWQIILPFRRQWAMAALERSKAADLLLLSRLVDSPASISFLKQVFTKHASRVRELDVDLGQFDPSTLAAWFKDLQQSSLRLHSLTLVLFLSWDSYPTFPTGVVVTDSLRRLEIRNCNGPWYSMSFPALTTLNLRRITNRPPLNKFLELLRGLATLQVLDMEDSLPFASDPNHTIGFVGPIHLPSLQYLCLSSNGNPQEVSNILIHIIVPPTATLRFAVTIGSSDIDALASSFSAFVSHMGQSLSYSTLHILSVARFKFHLRAWNDDDDERCPPSVAPNLDLVVVLKIHPMAIDPQMVVRKVFSSLPLFDITTLALEITPVHDLLQHTIGNLPRLQKVTAIGDCTVELIKELTRRRTNYDNTQLSDYYSVTFPALEVLWIRKGDFSKKGSLRVEQLQDCLMERYERKAELLKLKLTNCRKLFHSYVEKLREIVVEVEWDERN